MGDQELTPEEWLAHYGVKGMKWGVHNSKPTSNDIHNARIRDGVRTRAINAQVDKVNQVTIRNGSKKEFNREAKKLEELTMDYLKSPDRATALRMTKGEKIANGLFAVALPGVGTAAVGISAGARVAVRKAVEKDVRKAQSGGYNN